ncbi:MAG: pyrroline-5-carboxylate reductase [Pirellulales bacterium]
MVVSRNMLENKKIAFLGAGQMARALARGFVHAGLLTGEQIVASDPSAGALNEFIAFTPGAKQAESNRRATEKADLVFLAVKPRQIEEVLAEIAPAAAGKLFVSIAAGIKLESLAAALGPKARLIRVMPNTPCLVGQSASAYSVHASATSEDARTVDGLLSAVGKAFRLEEHLLDAVTGLSGSGPAFVCLVIEALSDGGVKMGLPRDVATALAVQTVLGTARLIQQTEEHPAEVRDRVTSPGGTTIAGLAVLESAAVRGALISAVEQSTLRSQELGR